MSARKVRLNQTSTPVMPESKMRNGSINSTIFGSTPKPRANSTILDVTGLQSSFVGAESEGAKLKLELEVNFNDYLIELLQQEEAKDTILKPMLKLSDAVHFNKKQVTVLQCEGQNLTTQLQLREQHNVFIKKQAKLKEILDSPLFHLHAEDHIKKIHNLLKDTSNKLYISGDEEIDQTHYSELEDVIDRCTSNLKQILATIGDSQNLVSLGDNLSSCSHIQDELKDQYNKLNDAYNKILKFTIIAVSQQLSNSKVI